MNPSPVYPAGPFHSVSKPVSDSSSVFPDLADPEKNVISIPRTVPLKTVPKARRGTYQDVKLILRDRPTTIYCQTCQRNVISNLRGRRKAL